MALVLENAFGVTVITPQVRSHFYILKIILADFRSFENFGSLCKKEVCPNAVAHPR
jgi:hypothetical protein